METEYRTDIIVKFFVVNSCHSISRRKNAAGLLRIFENILSVIFINTMSDTDRA